MQHDDGDLLVVLAWWPAYPGASTTTRSKSLSRCSPGGTAAIA
ncbi:hypothetical protein NKH18_25740 [Streptomyces sp. M10(2022)]